MAIFKTTGLYNKQISGDDKISNNVNRDMKLENDQAPILIPSESILEGYVKTKKSFRIECDFYGTIMSSQKVVVGKTSKIIGDIICRDLDLSGELIGNIFCSRKIKVSGGSKISGKVYTKLFENDESSDLDCVIQIPKNEHIQQVEDIFEALETSQKLSNDDNLNKIRKIFYENVYSHSSNPDIPLIYDFTSQIKEEPKSKNAKVVESIPSKKEEMQSNKVE